ncbi:MAG: tRNA dihydrouridine synthase DusB [Lachnospiraceae bacterium]|nr:tRNA dihydrouridine synthase DusB [Lachnospiraceae bacterium]
MSNAIHPIQIGNVKLKNNLVLAPMAGVTDLAYRPLCMEMGAGMSVMEMVSAKAILYNNKKTFDMLRVDESEHPVSLQLFGSEPEVLAEAAKRIEEWPFDVIDINMGCPVPKVVNNGEGSALMKNPILVGQIVEALVKATDRPVTVKFRTGFDEEHLNACEIAHVCEESGASAVAVHGRTREQMYMGEADWDMIRRVKETVSIPVFGNGDLRSGKDVEKMYKETNCDGFLIARAARGNPWVFREILDYCEKGILDSRPTLEEMRDMILRHASRIIESRDEFSGIREMRKHVAWYTAGLRNSTYIRREVNKVESFKDLEELLERGIAHES